MRITILMGAALLSAQGAALAQGDFADGLTGGPDHWEVFNLPSSDTLNVRKAAGAGQPVVGKLAPGERVRNLGCRMEGEQRWCHVEAGTEQPYSGWVNGHYLREAAVASPSTVHSKGSLPCATAVGQPTGSCPFRASHGPGGNAGVWITLPSGKERYIQFREGKPVATDPGLELSFERNGDLTLLKIGGERYEVPDAVIYGG